MWTLFNSFKLQKVSNGIRVAFIPNTEGAKVADRNNLNRLVWAAVNTLPSTEATNVVLKWLDQEQADRVIPPAINDILSESELHVKMLRVYSQRVLHLKASQSATITNGKILGPLDSSEVFTSEDFGLIERLSNHQHADKIKPILRKYDDDNDDNNSDSDSGDFIMKLIALLVPRQQSRSRFAIPNDIRDSHTVVRLPPKSSSLPYFDIFAVLDPGNVVCSLCLHLTRVLICIHLLAASRGAQKLAPILILLRNVINCNMRVVLCAVDKHSDMPVKK